MRASWGQTLNLPRDELKVVRFASSLSTCKYPSTCISIPCKYLNKRLFIKCDKSYSKPDCKPPQSRSHCRILIKLIGHNQSETWSGHYSHTFFFICISIRSNRYPVVFSLSLLVLFVFASTLSFWSMETLI